MKTKDDKSAAPVWTTYRANGKAFPVDPELDAVKVYIKSERKTIITGFNHHRAWHAALVEATRS